MKYVCHKCGYEGEEGFHNAQNQFVHFSCYLKEPNANTKEEKRHTGKRQVKA